MSSKGNEFTGDQSKVLNEWALAAGRSLQSQQTGFVHYYYGEMDQQGHQTIPLFENALFALALLRSRLVENIQEAKELIKRLLVFQNLQEDSSHGNFPVYLHDYPVCHDPSQGLQLLTPFYWMISQFGHVLGAELRRQLEQASRNIIAYSLPFHAMKPFPYFLMIRLFAAQFAFGKLWHNEEWLESGKQQLDHLAERQLVGWSSTKHLGDLLPGLQMVYPSIKNSLWSPLWQLMQQTWHAPTGSYAGPCVREWQEGEEPQPNLYDLYAGYFAGQFSRRAGLLRPYHLHASFIQASADRFDAVPSLCHIEGVFRNQRWEMAGQQDGIYTLLEKTQELDASVEQTFTPFRMLWGDLNKAHSFVCQGGHYEKLEYTREGESAIILTFDLGAEVPPEDREKRREIEFFADFGPDVKFSLGGKASMTFEMGQELKIGLGQHELTLAFDLMEGEGDFFGHVTRGNRPSQVDLKGERRFQAYDWTFFLRTIRRQGPCRIRATLKFASLRLCV